MELILISAMAKNKIIGKDNKIPWQIPEEMRHFKETTMGHAVIMGRKTFESIGTPLPGRLNIVLSTNKSLHCPGFTLAATLKEGIDCCQGHSKIFITGGKTLYEHSMHLVNTILLSVLDQEYEGDTVFPHIPEEQFKEVSRKRLGQSDPFTLFTYHRILRN